MGGIDLDFLFRILAIDPFDRVESQPIFFEFRVPDHQPQNDGHTGLFCHTRGACGGTCREAEEIHKNPFARQHVLVDKDTYCVTAAKSAQDAARKITFFDGLSATQAPVVVDELVHQGIVEGPDDEVAGIAVHSVSERAEFPIPEVASEKKHTSALTLRLGVILKSVVDYQLLDVTAVPAWKMREVCQHPAEVAKQAEKHSAALALRPIRESQLQVQQTHFAQTGPKPIAQKRQKCAKRPCQTVRQHPEQFQQGESRVVFHPMS